MANIIEVDNLYYSYKDGTQALRGLSLSIGLGSKVALLGPNGAGKSTLLLHLNGINLPQQGRVLVDGRQLDKKSEKWARAQVGMVFQDPDDQVFSSTVWEDVSFGPYNMGLESGEIEKRVNSALCAVHMEEFRDKAPYNLSYGQKKRVAIAGVLAMWPKIIVLDEPMAFLDPRGKDDLLAILNKLNSAGTTVVVATHDVEMAAEWADQVIIIKNGCTLAQGDVSLLVRPDIVTEAGLHFPRVARIFRALPELNLSSIPRTVDEAVAIIRKLIK